MRKNYFSVIAFILFALSASAQMNRREHQEKFQLHITRTPAPLHVDGVLDEAAWEKAEAGTNFSMKWPRDGGPAPEQTLVQCLYDDKFLYIGITAMDNTPNYVIQSLKRDAGYWDSDGAAVILDPANIAVSGYFFGVNPAGVQTEALLSAGADGELDTNWDNTWWVETHQYTDRWVAEYAIPMRILRFKEGQTSWGINIIRNDLTNGIYSTWATIPFQFDGTDLGWTGALVWDAAPHRAKSNYSLAPYASAGIKRDYENNEDWKVSPRSVGLDAKFGVGSGLNLDVTVNPDFSQIEIDEQIVNLSRFNVQLPEKRTFFLENADVFSNFGIPPIRPFFSRRIGLDNDGRPLPILGGLRLTGNLNSDTRIGALNMQTLERGETPGYNYSALSLTRRLFGRSTVSGYFLNRQAFEGRERRFNDFSRNAGVESLFVSPNARWTSWMTHHRSFTPGVTSKNWWGNTGFNYNKRKYNILVDIAHMGENYHADMGFEQRIENYDELRDTTLRIGYNFLFTTGSYRIFPKKEMGKLNFVEIGFESFNVMNPDGTFNESSNRLFAEWNLKNTSSFRVYMNPNTADVPVSFKFDDAEDLEKCPPLPAGAYQYVSGGIEWGSDYRKRFFLSVNASTGQFYNGKIYSGGIELNWRIKTLANIRLAAAYNRLDFPAPYCDAVLFNLTPRVEVFFAKNIWWTTFLQYNTQADNFNINSRLQWRYRPMSDFFIVYTDNYSVSVPGVKSRALVAKLGYWF